MRHQFLESGAADSRGGLDTFFVKLGVSILEVRGYLVTSQLLMQTRFVKEGCRSRSFFYGFNSFAVRVHHPECLKASESCEKLITILCVQMQCALVGLQFNFISIKI